MVVEENRAKYSRSKDSIELIITYECNLKCYNCEAMVRQAPSGESMTVEQVNKFISESISMNIKWKNIRVLGGEPTMHKDIDTIINNLIKYKENYSPFTIITLVTNGFSKFVINKIESLSNFDICIENSNKKGNIQPQFHPVNVAPMDLKEYKGIEINKGCWITSLCGIALDSSGYYPCSTSAAIDRVFCLNKGKKSLPELDDEMEEYFSTFCKLCGHYNNGLNYVADFNIEEDKDFERLQLLVDQKQKYFENQEHLLTSKTSETWDNALKNWIENKPRRTRY